jgi:uroporphyrinogen III methyltransferase/synthase
MKVLITRPRAQANDFAEKLRDAGFEPIFFPVIEIKEVENNTELENAIKNIEKYAWVVFTSVNAAPPTISPHFLQKWGESKRGGKIAAVGSKTAAALRKYGIEPDFIPDEFVGANIMSGLGDVKGKWILLPRAELASKELPAAIVKADGIAHEIIVYRTLPAVINEEGLRALKSGVDFVTFTSASTVENFVAIARRNNLDPFNLSGHPQITCIGPVTAQAAQDAGFADPVIAKEYTTDGLLEAICKIKNRLEEQ